MKSSGRCWEESPRSSTANAGALAVAFELLPGLRNSAGQESTSSPIKPHRVVHQERLLFGGTRGDLGDVVHQRSIVRRLFHIGVGPIGAPDHAFREALNERAPKRHDVVIGCAGEGHAFWAGHLNPEILEAFHEPVKALVPAPADRASRNKLRWPSL